MPNQISWIQKLLVTASVGSFTLLAAIAEPAKELISRNLIANATNETTQHSGSLHLDRVKKRGYLVCGVNGELPGFSFVNADGKYAGIDVDFCRAIAAAIFDDPNKVKFRDLNAGERFEVLKSGDIDLLSRNTTQMGLSNDFTRRIIKHIGNYSEIYERNLGRPFSLPRGRNALWQEGGLMYSPPFN